MTRVLIPLADGCEEMEAVITIDVLRRAKWEVTAAGLKAGPVTASRGVHIVPDMTWDQIRPSDFDMLVIPGGTKGVANLRADPRVVQAVRDFDRAGKYIAAICAGPLVLQEAGILAGRKVTCHPGVKAQLTQTKRLEELVVVDGRLITSQAAGTTFKFALTIIEQVDGVKKAEAVGREMVVF